MKGWRTIIINAVSFLIFALGWDPLSEYINPQIVAIAVTILNAILRFITTTPVGKKA